MLSPDELLKLATAYAGATGMRLRTVGRAACNNDKIFVRIAAGGGAVSRSIQQATDFFEHNWPPGVRWPAGVPGGPRMVVANTERVIRKRKIAAATQPLKA